MSVDVVEGPDRGAPSLVAVFGVGDDAVVGEEDEDVGSVRGCARRGRGVHLLVPFDAGPGSLAPPEDVAGFAIQAEGEELSALVDDLVAAPGVDPFASLGSGEEDEVAGDDGRGVAEGQGRLPYDDPRGSKLGGRLGDGGDARTVDAAEHRPVGGGENCRRQEQEKSH